MTFKKFKEHIKDFPKLNEVYLNKINEGYSLITIDCTSIEDMNLTFIDLRMKNKTGESILVTLNYVEQLLNEVHIKKLPQKEKIHPHLNFNKEIFRFKNFKKQFWGYNINEVYKFLDLIKKDYIIIEDEILAENKKLKEEIIKLKKENERLKA